MHLWGISARLNVPRDDLSRNFRAHSSPCPRIFRSCLFKLRIPLNEFLRAAARKADRHAPVFVLAFDAHNRSHAIAGMPHLASQHGIRVSTALCRGPAKGTLRPLPLWS